MESVSSSTPETKPANARGGDRDAITTRLETFYGNLHASSPMDTKAIPSQNTNDPRPFPNLCNVVHCVDENNNACFLPSP